MLRIQKNKPQKLHSATASECSADNALMQLDCFKDLELDYSFRQLDSSTQRPAKVSGLPGEYGLSLNLQTFYCCANLVSQF